jgi:aldose 1-epimerase
VSGNEKITLSNDQIEAEIWSLGAAVNDLKAPDRDGVLASVILGYADEAARRAGSGYLGEIVGPVANRIAEGGYEVDGTTYTPVLNEPHATLHGGPHGFSEQVWEVTDVSPTEVTLRLEWSDPDGGFPGPIRAEVTYVLEGSSLLHIVQAACPQAAPLNVVSHPYFNLSGSLSPVGDHTLQVFAERYLPIDDDSIPLPEAPSPVADTAFDLRQPQPLAQVMAADDPQIRLVGGVDHAFVLDAAQPAVDGGLPVAAVLAHEGSGRRLTIETDEPALQVYTGHMLADSAIAHPTGGPGTGVALEAEGYPDAPRRADFPSVLVRPGQTYQRRTRWVFSAR